MGKDSQFRKNYYFCLSFIYENRTQRQTDFNKKSLLEQIFRLVEISFRNSLCMATVAVSCRYKFLLQNLIPAYIYLISG